MATPRGQRIGIWVITVVMAVGAIGVYFVAILANNNDSAKSSNYQTVLAQYQSKVAAQAAELSSKYYATFSPFASRVHSFEKAAAQEKLVTEDLLVGDGETITDTTKFGAYYIGWNPDGNIFDQSIDGSSLKTPLGSNVGLDKGLGNAGLITGWKEGMLGMKIGGVREITIPSEKAYGSAGSGSQIPADTPIKFVVMAIPLPTEIPVPEELLTSQ
jgi:FKBP-type peptidyl-prolyl cis-trans isomerase